LSSGLAMKRHFDHSRKSSGGWRAPLIAWSSKLGGKCGKSAEGNRKSACREIIGDWRGCNLSRGKYRRMRNERAANFASQP